MCVRDKYDTRDSSMKNVMLHEQLIVDLKSAFDYTLDNNVDLVHDPSMPMTDVLEELEVERAAMLLIAYITRNTQLIQSNLEADRPADPDPIGTMCDRLEAFIPTLEDILDKDAPEVTMVRNLSNTLGTIPF